MIVKDIPGFDFYQIDEYGNVYKKEMVIKAKDGRKWVSKRKKMKQRLDKYGYKVVSLTKDGKSKPYLVHRLVALAFHPIDNSEIMQVNHKDGVKTNNHYKNLEWVTAKENTSHAIKNGLRAITRGEKNGASKLSERDVLKIRKMWDLGIKQVKIAELYGISKDTVWKIINKKLWTHI